MFFGAGVASGPDDECRPETLPVDKAPLRRQARDFRRKTVHDGPPLRPESQPSLEEPPAMNPRFGSAGRAWQQRCIRQRCQQSADDRHHFEVRD